MPLLFVFVFALKGVLYPSKDITLTHKHGDVKRPAGRFFDQKNFEARRRDKTPWCQQRKLAEMFNIGETAAANIKNEASICKEYEEFKGDLKRKRKGQFNDINEILYEWFKKFTVNIYPDQPMLKEEAIEIEMC